MKTDDLNSGFARAMFQFNEVFGFSFNPLLEVGAETLKTMSEFSAGRGRDDIAKKFAAFAAVENCEHEFDAEDLPCAYCGKTAQELGLKGESA